MTRTTVISGALAGVGGAGTRWAITKKLLLWSVLLLQLAFIGCIWLLQSGYNLNEISVTQRNENWNGGVAGGSGNGVQFVRQSAAAAAAAAIKTELKRLHGAARMLENVNRYDQDFFQAKINRLNRTEAEYEMALNAVEAANAEELWCYREGTLNETTRNGLYDEDIATLWELQSAQSQCKCAPGWHGRDCGQPEIIWRALMTHMRVADGSAALQLRQANAIVGLHRLYYMIELNHVNLDLLELQIHNVIEVVDCFLIYYISHSKENEMILSVKSLEHSLRQIFATAKSIFLLHYCQQWRTGTNCSTAAAYNQLRRRLIKLSSRNSVTLKSTDMLIYSNEPAVFVPQALKFLKYYATDVMPLRFRLKFNVYGYFWQHPNLTQISGVISSLIHLHNPQYGRNDPLHLQQQTTTQHAATKLTLGDLNHFGGWYCQYCEQPEQIVTLLQTNAIIANSSLLAAAVAAAAAELPLTAPETHVKFPPQTKHGHIDAAYIQQLIAHGIYIDGTTQLNKLRRYQDNYYAPQYVVAQQSTKYAQLLVNFYESFDDDIEDDSGF